MKTFCGSLIKKIRGIDPRHLSLILLFAATLFFALFVYEKLVAKQKEKAFEDLLQSQERIYGEVKIQSVKSENLASALARLSDENTKLYDLVNQMKSKPAEINYITYSSTYLQPETPGPIAFNEPPPEYMFELSGEIPVARFSFNKENEKPYNFETYGLIIRNSVVIGEKDASSLLQIASTKEPDRFVEVPIDEFKVSKTAKKHSVFEPHVGIGFTVSAGENPDFLASLFGSFIHPLPNLDVAGIRVAANGRTFQAGIDVVGYNVGDHIPVVNDLWIHAGVAVDIYAKPSAHISVSTKL